MCHGGRVSSSVEVWSNRGEYFRVARARSRRRSGGGGRPRGAVRSTPYIKNCARISCASEQLPEARVAALGELLRGGGAREGEDAEADARPKLGPDVGGVPSVAPPAMRREPRARVSACMARDAALWLCWACADNAGAAAGRWPNVRVDDKDGVALACPCWRRLRAADAAAGCRRRPRMSATCRRREMQGCRGHRTAGHR